MEKKITTRISELLEPTEEQKERMLNNILEKNKNENGKRRVTTSMKRIRHILVAAVMVFCLIITTTFAASYLGLDIKFLNFLNPSNDEQAEYLTNGAYVIDKQVKNKNGTLDIKQVIGDSNLTYILMDFTAPEGMILNADRYRFNCSVYSNYHDSYGINFIKLEDENTEDNKISIIMAINTEESLMGRKIQLEFRELEGAANLPKTFDEAATLDSEEQIFKTILKGNWSTSINVDFKDISNIYTPNSKVMVYGYEAILKSIAISPISITIKLESPFCEEICKVMPFEEVEYNTYLDELPITINYQDGSQETTTYFKGMRLGNYLTNTIMSIKEFDKVINDKEIKSITFFDKEILVNH